MIREFGDCGPFIEYYDEKKHKELNSSQFVCVLFPLTEHLTLVTVSERVKLAIYDTVIIKNGIPWSLDADCYILIEDRIEALGDKPLDVVEGNDDGKPQSHKPMIS